MEGMKASVEGRKEGSSRYNEMKNHRKELNMNGKNREMKMAATL